ncbi:hypothetical protein GF402_03035 [Candidatus Fermentibacteria bacterium]|nr:hypothetical protein [Candidatus Fermentibacteria bacterium]
MVQRLTDYALVFLGIFVLWLIFKLSRRLLNALSSYLRRKGRRPTSDRILLIGLLLLLAGLLFLPLLTAAIASISPRRLPGGMPIHLLMVIISIIVFSMSEDLFRTFPTAPPGTEGYWPLWRHLRTVVPAVLVFWALGAIFISPIFYAGLTVIIMIFYLYALACRKRPTSDDENGK